MEDTDPHHRITEEDIDPLPRRHTEEDSRLPRPLITEDTDRRLPTAEGVCRLSQ